MKNYNYFNKDNEENFNTIVKSYELTNKFKISLNYKKNNKDKLSRAILKFKENFFNTHPDN